MSMSDLELLQLVDTVKEKQRGPKGEPGVGIDRIEQFDETGFTLRLTDGSFQRIDLPTPKDGEAGPVGPSGRQGEKGDPGRAGRDGSQGLPGRDGQDGLPGSFIETAVVNSNGHLLLGISNGSIIDVGRVIGPAGATGPVGATGLAGESGKDGTAVLSGPRAPTQDDGVEGDHWIDISTAEFAFFKRDGNGWTKLANLRQPAKDPRMGIAGPGGGGGSGGGGTGELQNTRTLPLINGGSTIRKQAQARGLPSVPDEMATQEDANLYFLACLQTEDVTVSDSVPRPPYQIGQLWFSTNPEELTLYVYDGSVWVPAAPPVSLDGIESNITLLQEVTSQLQTDIATTVIKASEEELKVLDLQESQAAQDTKIEALEASQTVQDNQIIELEEEIESLAPSLDRGKWNLAELGEGVTLAAGQYAMGIGANRVYCEEQYAQCLAAIDGNPSENPEASGECNRIASACFNAVDNGTEYFMNDWSHATLLHFHKTDSEGKNHTFADYKVGMFIDLFDQGDTGFAVFEITAAATLDGDVYTIGVHPVQHEGEAAGLARVKVFELAGADPTEFVRNTGDTMTGTLYIRPPKDSAGLRIYAPQGDAGAGQADATQLVRVANSHNQYVFYVEESGAIAGKDGMLPTQNRHLVSKKYVDELIAAELTAPARFEWKVYVNADGTPQQGSANLNGASMSDTSVIRLHKRAQNAPVPIKGHGSGLTMYKHSPSPKLYYSTILSAWSKSGAEWQWKGTAEIDQIKLFSDYIQITLASHKWSNMNFSNTGYYRFTVGGLF